MTNVETRNSAEKEEGKGAKKETQEEAQENTNSHAKYPDPDKYINAKYSKFSLHELQNELEKFSKSISTDKAKLDHLIPKKFSQFIQQKKLMDRILDDYYRNYLTDQNSDSTIKNILQKFDHLISKYPIDLEERENDIQNKELSKGAMLLNYKEILRSNLLNFPVFLETLEKSKKIILEDEKSIDLIRPELIDFLAVIYERISRDETTFEEVCGLANLYIDVLSFQGDLTTEQKRLQIHNTVLVNFKESTYSRARATEEYYKYLIASLSKALEYLSEDHAEDAIEHTHQMFYRTLCKTDPKYARLIFKHIEDFYKSAKLTPSNLKVFKGAFSDMKVDLFEYFVAKGDLNEGVNTFDIFLGCFRERETGRAQEILLKKVEKHLMSSKRHGFEYLNDQARDIRTISACLGTKESRNMKQLEKILRGKEEEEIRTIAKEFVDGFSRGKSDVGDREVGILMRAVKIIDSSEEYHREILGRCKEEIMKEGVVTYFLREYLGVEMPMLDRKEKERVEKYKGQFGFLLGKNKKEG